jgi:acyl-CoA thioesterase FadM
MSVEFKRPVPIGQPIHGEGRVTSVRRRIVETEGVLTDADGNLLARATATFVGAQDDKKAELKARYGFVLVPDGEADATMPGQVGRR